MELKTITNPAAAKPIGPYCHAKVCGNMVFLSGSIGVDVNGDLAGDDITSQTHQAMKNIASNLEAAGSDLDHVVKFTNFMADLSDFADFNTAYGSHLKEGNYPARTTIAVKALPKGAKVEIDTIAVLK